MRKIIVSFVIFIYTLGIAVCSFGTDTIPVWNQENGAVMTLATDETVDMKLSSGSAILIEANSREDIVRTQSARTA